MIFRDLFLTYITKMIEVFRFKISALEAEESEKLIRKIILRLEKREFLGAFKSRLSLEEIVMQAILEDGASMTDEKVKNLTKLIESNRAKKVFYVQASISVLVLLACFAFISAGANENTEKLLAGLIGTVLGYWLR